MSSASPTRQGVLVGCFTLVGIAILIAAIVTVGRMNDAFSRKIEVSAVFAAVDGLKKGDSVWFSGVPVGSVRSLELQKGPSVRVALAIDANSAPFIAGDAVAQVSSDGLIGSKIVVLTGGSSKAARLAHGDELSVDVAISMTQLMDEIKTTNDNLQVITTDVKVITGRLAKGEGSVGALLADDALYGEVQATMSSMKRASSRADRVAGDVALFTAELNREGNLPHELVTDTTSYPRLSGAVGSLEATAADAATMMDGIEAGLADEATPMGVLLHDREAGGNLGETFENLNASSKLLEEDLEAVQHNFLLRGFFKKRERKERKEKKKAAKR